MFSKLALTLLLTGDVFGLPALSPSPTKSSFQFNVAAPATKSPAHVAPTSPDYLSLTALHEAVSTVNMARSLDDVRDVDEIFVEAQNSKRATTACLDSTATDTVINSLFYYGGANTKVSLCPGATISLTNAIFFTAANQELSTQGYPTGSMRATIVVTGADQSTALYSACDACSGVAVKNIQINGNRPGLGWMGNGQALVEMGGNAADQIIDNCHVYEPRGWSALHGIEGYQLNCRRMTVSNNQVGPSGHAPNTGWQFKKRDVTGNYNPGQWADGISMACKESTVVNNIITDATDGAIVCFTCASTISGNTIISNNRQLLGGINMVDFGPDNGNYTGVVVTGNTIIAQNNFIKVGLAIGTMVWGSDNRTASRTYGGSVTANTLTSGSLGYFGFGAAVGGHANVAVSGTAVSMANFGGGISNVCFSTLIPTSQAFIIDPSTTPGSVVQPEFVQTPVVFLICQEPGSMTAVGTSPIVSNSTAPSGAAQVVPANSLSYAAIATSSTATSVSPASAAIDGIINGWTPNGGDETKEWTTSGSMTNGWLLLTWPGQISMSSVALYDRINLNDHITAGLLTFDDGSTVDVPSLADDGSAVIVTFPTRNSKTLLFTIINVSSFTQHAGLAEIAVFGSSTPIVASSVSSSSSVASAAASSTMSSTSNAASTSTSSSSSSVASSTSSMTSTSTDSASSTSSSVASSASSMSSTSASTDSTSSTSTSASSVPAVVATPLPAVAIPPPAFAPSSPAVSSGSTTPLVTASSLVNLAKSSIIQTAMVSSALTPITNLGDGDVTTSWTGKGRAGSKIIWNWSTAQTMNSVSYSTGSIAGIQTAMLEFGDFKGRVLLSGLNVTGTTVTFDFPARTTKRLVFTIRTVDQGTSLLGLNEAQMFNNPSSITNTVSAISLAKAVSKINRPRSLQAGNRVAIAI